LLVSLKPFRSLTGLLRERLTTTEYR